MSRKPSTRIKEKTSINMPSILLKDRTVSSFEAIVEFLKDEKNFTYHEIGVLLNRNERNIWESYHRAKKKRKNKYSQTVVTFVNNIKKKLRK